MAVDLSLKTRRASALDMRHDKGEPNHASSVRCIRNSGDQSQNEIGSRPAAKTVMGSTPAESGGRVQFRIENILSGGISSETDKSSTEKYQSDFGYVPPRQEVRQQFRHVTGAIGSEHRIAPRNQVLQIARDLNSYDVISYQPAHQAGAYHRDALPVCCVHTSTGSIPRLSLTAAPLAQTDIQMSERVWHPQSDGGSYPEEAKYDAGSSVMIYPTESNRLHEFVLRDHKRKANYIAPSDGSERLRAIENGGAVIVPDPSGLHPDIGYQPTNVAAYPGSSRLVHVPAGVRQSSTMIIHSASMPPSGIEPHSAMVQHSGMASHSGMVPHCGMASAGLVQPSDLPRPSISMNATGTYPDSNLIQTQQMTCPRGDKPTPQFDLYSESADYRILPGAVATPVGQSYNNMMQWVPPDYHGLPRSRIMKEAFRDDKCVDRQPTRAEKRLCPHPPPVDVICGPKAKLYEASWQETAGVEFKRPRTSFTDFQLLRLKAEFRANCYLSEERRLALANELGLGENQVKIWFQNNRAKLKKASYQKNSDSSRVDGIYTS